MKLKLTLICLLIGFGLSLQAQDYKVVGMESLPTDMTAREHIKTDENGKQCAVLRIITQNIMPEQREGFHFESDWGSYVVERSIVDGEIRLWVSPGLKTLKIRHSKLGPWELHTANYGIAVEALHTYKIVIQGTMAPASDDTPVKQQYLAFQISPADAELEVDGEIWPVSSRGTARRRVNEGKYNYRVTALDFKDKEGSVTVADTSVLVTVALEAIKKAPKVKPNDSQQTKVEPIQPEINQPTSHKTFNSAFFVMANAAYSFTPQTSFGLTVGSVKKLGWYVSLSSNFKFKSTEYECDYSGTISNAPFEYSYSGTKSTSRFGATAGLVVRIYDPVYAYIGGGYGFRNVFWELENGNWAKSTDDSYRGISIDAGLMLHFRGFGFSLGVETIGINYFEAKIGIGYTLKR